MVDATDLGNWALTEKSIKWPLSNSGKPKAGNRYGNPEPSQIKYCVLSLEGAEARRELP